MHDGLQQAMRPPRRMGYTMEEKGPSGRETSQKEALK